MVVSVASHADWYSTGRLASYVVSRRGLGDAISMVEARQPAGDMSDPATGDLVLVMAVQAGIRHTSNLGAGRFVDQTPRGGLLLIPPGFATDIRVENEHVIRCFSFSAERYRDAVARFRSGSGVYDFGRLHRRHFILPAIQPVLDRAWLMAAAAQAGPRLYAETVANYILAELSLAADASPAMATGGLTPRQLKRVSDHLLDHLADDVSLAELAALVGLSAHHLCRAFKASTGLPPHRWRLARRIERARELLEHSEISITDVAAAVGYEDPSQLAAVFRKTLGMSPTRYRRERRS